MDNRAYCSSSHRNIRGIITYTASVVIRGIVYGEWEWSWAEFLGSALGGLLGGLFSIIPVVGSYLSSFLTGLFTTVLTDAFNHALNGTEFNLRSSLQNGFKSGVLSTLFVGLINVNYAIKGITFGRGSWSMISNQIYTKFRRNLIRAISLRTFGKMLGLSLYESIPDTFYNGLT